jgi:hypothetical protein
MDCQDLCWKLLSYASWVPWVGTYSQGLDMHMAWVDTGNQAMARCTYRLYPDEAGVPCSVLAQVMPDGAYRCPQHALYWRLEHRHGTE